MPPIETLHDDDESDIILWPADLNGRRVNYRMTPERALALADALETHELAEQQGRWRPEIDALRQAGHRPRPQRRSPR